MTLRLTVLRLHLIIGCLGRTSFAAPAVSGCRHFGRLVSAWRAQHPCVRSWPTRLLAVQMTLVLPVMTLTGPISCVDAKRTAREVPGCTPQAFRLAV